MCIYSLVNFNFNGSSPSRLRAPSVIVYEVLIAQASGEGQFPNRYADAGFSGSRRWLQRNSPCTGLSV